MRRGYHACTVWLDEELQRTRDRLEFYLERGREILSRQGVKSYTIGPRSFKHSGVALADLTSMIEMLRRRVAEPEAWSPAPPDHGPGIEGWVVEILFRNDTLNIYVNLSKLRKVIYWRGSSNIIIPSSYWAENTIGVLVVAGHRLRRWRSTLLKTDPAFHAFADALCCRSIY